MIDLSFLTEEEQEAIMKVLQRDAQLKKAEEDRVRVLEDTIDDTNELKNKTGQWFYEAKSKRHRDKIHGADLIRASIRKKKPLTIAELTQSRTDKTKKSWVNNVNKDLFVPPELVGVMEEPDREDEEEKTQGQLYRSAPKVDTLSFEEPPQSTIKGVSSPSKQRKNPFNDPTLEVGFELNTENHISENGSAHLYDLAEKDIMPSSQRSEHNEKMPKFEQNEDNQNFSDALDGLERKSEQKIPKPKVRTVTYKIADTQSDSDSSFSKPPKRNDSLNGTGTRKGILKRSPSSSSTDSEILRISQSLDSQSKTLSPNSPILEGEAVKNYLQNPPDQSSQSSIDRLKQVRFTSVDVPDTLPPTPDTHKGREIGEFDLLESDYAKNSKDDIDGVKPLYNEHESIQNSIYAHPERVDMDPDVAATASNEEDRDITLDASSNLCLNLKTEAPGPPQVPPTSLITTQPHQSSSEVLQEKRSLVDAASIKTSNHIFDNIRENEEPTSGTFPNRDSSDLSSLASQASTLSIDQQPVYAKINTPRLSKLDSSDKLQGKESIDESDPSRKTETMIMDNTKPNNDDKRDNFNVPQNANLLKFNTDVQESKDETFRTSKHFSDQQPLHAEIKSPQVSKLSASDHQQGSEEELSPVLAVLRRSSAKPVPSKSLEDLSSASSNQRADKQEAFYESISEHQKTDKQESFHEPVSESPTGPSYPDNRFSDPEKVKRLSKSVPDFLQDESDDRETDSASEGSFQLGRHKKTPSSLTNLSGSSGMASLSSVSGSVMSIYSGDFGNVDIKGNIQFAIDYVDQLQEFHIFVAQCKELAVAEVKKNRSDPYVKSYLLPDKEKMGKRKTAVRKKTLNPAYNEILRYKISKQTLLTQKLNLSVWHNDMFGRNSFLGEVDIDLATWDWNNKQMNWFPLQPRTPAAGMGLEYRGEMTVALKHSTVPTSGKNAASNGEVYIWVKSCSNLPVLRGNRINSFVKCTVLPDTSRKSRQKTRTVDKTVNPVFNHTMVYDGFRAEDLREACVELTVWDHNRLSNHFLGGLRLGSGSGKSYGTPVDWMDSTSYETSLWKRMISSPDQWVEDTLQLRMLMMAKMTK
ncbi:synaptotagmin-like protein 2 isoform X11 [Pleurodeles waltl]|uniref:synaptotagmin-like protein 2 isoform X11 n=1 Tax=Pleurodeles waltl TaxID=8319 RepID=UPI0037099E19